MKEVLADHAQSEQPFNLGAYMKMRRAQAIDGKGLVHNKALIEPIYQFQPSGRFHVEQLERCISQILDAKPTINNTQFP